MIGIKSISSYICSIKKSNTSRIFNNEIINDTFIANKRCNTVSSSISIILEKYIHLNNDKILLCGFGAGLSIYSLILHKGDKNEV